MLGLDMRFFGGNGKRNLKANAKAIKSVASPVGLRSSPSTLLRAERSALRVLLDGPTEVGPFRRSLQVTDPTIPCGLRPSGIMGHPRFSRGGRDCSSGVESRNSAWG